MRHWAELDETNTVLRVIVSDTLEWVTNNLGGTWVETFKDGQRVRLAGIGFTYDADRDAFIPPKPFESWVLNEESCLWEPPVAYPTDGSAYDWNEDSQTWVERV